MKTLMLMLLATALTGLCEAQLPPHQLYGQAPGTPGDCLAIQSVRPSLGFVVGDSQTPCSPAFLTTAYTNATTSYTAVLSLPVVQGSTTLTGKCDLVWEDSSTAGTPTFAVQLSAAPTDLWVIATPSSGTFVAPTYTTITTTTQTAVTGALVTATANAPYKLSLSFALQNAATANTLTVYAENNSASYTLTVEPGSSWVP